MRHLFASGLATIAALGLIVSACSQTSPAPTQAPAKPAEPTKAAASAAPTTAPAPAQPTAAPAKTVNWPEKGKTITLIVPYGAGGGGDIGARILAPMIERELGTTVEVVNKPGASSQIGVTELAKAKPDGYTIGFTHLPAVPNILLDPDKKAAFTRKDLQPVALHVIDPGVIVVKADSPFKTVQDVVNAAKAKPGTVKTGDSGVLSEDHLGILQLQQLTGAKFATVHFNSGADGLTALLGDHIDVQFSNAGQFMSSVKGGQVRMLAVEDKQESPFYPGVKTLASQGFPVYTAASRGISVPAGTPKEIVDKLSLAIKTAMETDSHKAKMAEMGLSQRYMGPADFDAYWTEIETMMKPLIEVAKKEAS